MKSVFSNIIGTFIFDESAKISKQILYKNSDSKQEMIKSATKLIDSQKKSKKDKLTILTPKNIEQIKPLLSKLKDPKYFKQFYLKNRELTITAIKGSVNDDNLIVQTISSINEIDKTCNLLSKRLREWSALTLPELEKSLGHHERFAKLLATESISKLKKGIKTKETQSMGADLTKKNITPIIELAKQITSLYELRQEQEKYLEQLMQKHCPNFLEIAGPTIGAKIFEHGKSLRRLALMPSSTIQLLGAEKALFRHMKTGSKSPKYGVIFSHYLIQTAHPKDKGMFARSLASYLSRAIRIDFFKGEFIGDKLRKELEKKFNYKKR